MSYYLRAGSGLPQLWRIDAHCAVRLDVSNPETTCFKANPSETIWDAIRRQTPWFEPDGQCPFQKMSLAPGEFYPRIARPIKDRPYDALWGHPSLARESHFIAVARGQLATLARQLDRICQTIHPTEKTFDTFGHDTRNLLILACTEVEMHWRGVLTANSMARDRYTTDDYVKLLTAMKLGEYAVRFSKYPWLPDFRPYCAWSANCPTQSLQWYHAYNSTKHDRENNFEKASLRHAFEAISACVIMMVAQFGLPGLGQDGSELRSFCNLLPLNGPAYPLSEVYMYPLGGTDWSPVDFPFGTQ